LEFAVLKVEKKAPGVPAFAYASAILEEVAQA
jgi:hypothetical protein